MRFRTLLPFNCAERYLNCRRMCINRASKFACNALEKYQSPGIARSPPGRAGTNWWALLIDLISCRDTTSKQTNYQPNRLWTGDAEKVDIMNVSSRVPHLACGNGGPKVVGKRRFVCQLGAQVTHVSAVRDTLNTRVLSSPSPTANLVGGRQRVLESTI